MDFKKVASHFRNETTPLAVSQVVILCNQQDFNGFGKLRREGAQLVLEVTIDGTEELPRISGVITSDRFWKIGGMIENEVPFWGTSIPHQHTTQGVPFLVHGAEFSFSRIFHLSVDGTIRDALTNVSSETERADLESGRGWMESRLTDYPLVWREEITTTVKKNPFTGESTRYERDTLRGEFGNFEYGLIQHGTDCSVHLRLKPNSAATIAELTRVSKAFYSALAFVHGKHTWPQWERIDGPGGYRSEYATGIAELSRNIHTPITETSCANGSKHAEVLSKATQCFLRGDSFSERMDAYLFVAREAAATKTPSHVGTLRLCSVFEGFTDLLYEELCSRSATSEESGFINAKSELVQFVEERVNNEAATCNMAAWKRFLGLVQSARPLRVQDKFQHLIAYFGIPYDKLKPALDAWKSHRHSLAHGAETGDDGGIDQMLATSRIAGAINVLAAAALGCSGLMVLSRIEDRYVRLPDRGTAFR